MRKRLIEMYGVDEALPASAWKDKTVEELVDELVNLTDSLPSTERASALAVLGALRDKVRGTGDQGSSSMTSTKTFGSVKMQ